MAKKPIKSKTAPMPVEKLSSTEAPEVRNTKSEEAREREYRARSALDDIERSEKHKADRDLMKDVKKLGREKMKNLKKIC